jgi:hypothetical protein
MAGRMQKRRGTAAQWAATNPVLAAAEPGVEVDTGREKNGDGVRAWNDLPYVDTVGLATKADAAATTAALATKADAAATTAALATKADAAATTAALATKVDAAALTANGNLLTRVAGVPGEITRANLAADAAFSSRFGSPVMEGVPVWLQGDSWVAGTATATSWGSRIGSRLNSGPVSNRGVGGDMSHELVSRMLGGNGSTAWTPNQRGAVVFQIGQNDNRRMGTDARAIAVFKRALGLCIHLARSETKTEQSSATFVGPWTSTANAWEQASGGTTALTSTVGHYADFTVTGDAVTIVTGRTKPAFNGGTFTVREGGTLLATFNCGAGTDGPGATYPKDAAWDYVHITGLGAGSHTLRLECTVAGPIYFDCWMTPRAAPPQVVLVQTPNMTTWAGGAPYDQGSNAAMALYNTAIEEVAALFPAGQVTVCDLRPGWDPATMLASDAGHPNDRGAAFIADRMADHLARLPYRNGMNLLSVQS